MLIKWLLVPILFISLLSGCAGNTAGKMTLQYENMGKALKVVHNSGNKLCAEQVLSPEDCIRIKKIYTDTRKIYLITGDTLIFAIELNGTEWGDSANIQYATLTKAFSDLTLQWLRLTTELGLIKNQQ